MTPSPITRHQITTGRIFHVIMSYLENAGHSCQVFIAPLDVVLDLDNVVQPDVFIVCDVEKIKEYIFGAPDVTFEVASPSTMLKDRREKMELYERFGVKEYFLVDPEAEFVEKYMLRAGRYNGRVGIYAGDDTFQIDTIGLEITTKELFSF